MPVEHKPLIVDLPTGPRSFSGPAEVEAFVGAEKEFWEWLPRGGPLETLRSHFFEPLDEMIARLEPWRRRQHDEQQCLDELRQSFATAYGSPPRTLFSGATAGKFVAELRSSYGDEVAGSATLAMISPRNPNSARMAKGYIGIAFAAMFAAGMDTKNRSAEFDQLLERCKTDFEHVRSEAKEQIAQSIADREEQKSSHAKLLGEHEAKFKDSVDDAEQVHSTLISQAENHLGTTIKEMVANAKAAASETQERLNALEAKYKDIMALKEPSAYWTDEQAKHAIAAGVWGCVSVGVGVGAVAWLYNLATRASDAFMATTDANAWKFFAAKLPPILLGLALFWLIRILVRAYSAHHRLWMDAGERVALAKTYLALHAQNPNMNDADRSVVLQQLLRSAAANVDSDDAAPQITIGKLS